MKNYNNEILNDCSWFAEKHRGKNKLSGAHWSTIIRFTKLFDEAARLQQRVDTLEAYIDEFTPDSMQIAQLKAENEKLHKRIVELEQERRWIPVSERLPEEGQPVLIDFGNNEITVGIWFWENEPEEWSNGTDYVGWQHWNYGSDKFEPSDESPLRWQPLPQPQKEGE